MQQADPESARTDGVDQTPQTEKPDKEGKGATAVEAAMATLETGQTHFWSRSRQELWHKGATSGHTQTVTGIWADCDADVLLVQVEPAGPACHTGAVSCFFRTLEDILD